MSRVRTHPGSRHARGFTLVEVLVAILIALAFMAGALAAFIQILRASDMAEAEMAAIANGRVALDALAIEVKQANYIPGSFHFVATNNHLANGDAIDNDRDGAVDEELPDGQDDDGDWTAGDDRHAQISGASYERVEFRGIADLGDERVDEDTVFDSDELEFDILPDPADPLPRYVRVRFYIGTWEGRDHVLLKDTSDLISGLPAETSPLAEGVLSFNALYWQANQAVPYWIEDWDSANPAYVFGMLLPMPAAVYLSLHVYADDRPIDNWSLGQPARIAHLSTVVNVEQTIHDPRFLRP
jgi:prepilin-type N-terminal cleavage/methylation domain-containing protein